MKTKEEIEKRITELNKEMLTEVLNYALGGLASAKANKIEALNWVLRDKTKISYPITELYDARRQ